MKILLITPYSKDANSFWRSVGPLSYLQKVTQGKITITVSSGQEAIAWDTVGQYDLLFLHRPCRPDDLIMLQIAKNMQVPVWVDYDDWLFHLPNWNPVQHLYHTAGVQQVIAQCVGCADLISVSTTALYDQFKKVNPNVVILPNAYRSDLFPYRTNALPPRKIDFVWRGTNTHDGDLLSVADAFPKLPGKVTFLGGPSWMVLGKMDPSKYNTLTPQDNFQYLKHLYTLAPKVMLFPLDSSFFNVCKSNIAWIEGLHAGALCVAPDLPEWKRPGIITYKPNDAESFLLAATQAVSLTPAEHTRIVGEAFEYMKGMFDISIVNSIRMRCVEALMEGNFTKNPRDPFDQLCGMWVLSQLRGTPMQVAEETLKEKHLIAPL